MKKYKVSYHRKDGLYNRLLQCGNLYTIDMKDLKGAALNFKNNENYFLLRYKQKFNKIPDNWIYYKELEIDFKDIHLFDYQRLLKYSKQIDRYIEQYISNPINRVIDFENHYRYSYYYNSYAKNLYQILPSDIEIDANIKKDRIKYCKSNLEIDKRKIAKKGYYYTIEAVEYLQTFNEYWNDCILTQNMYLNDLLAKQIFATICKHKDIYFNSKKYKYYRERVFNGLTIKGEERTHKIEYLAINLAVIYMILEALSIYKNIPLPKIEFRKITHSIFGRKQ